MTGLDEGVKKALTDVKAGDYRLYSDGKLFYVINVREEIPSKTQTYVEAREAYCEEGLQRKS